jgi:hypothetical protein
MMTLEVLDRPRENQRVDLRDPVAVAEARALFQRLRGQGYFAYREDAPGGGGTVVRELPEEPGARVTFMPHLVGG